MNWEKQPASETRSLRAIIPFNEQPGFEQHFFAQAQAFHRIEERRAPGPESQAPNLRLFHRDVPRLEVFARDLRLGTFAQLPREPVRSGGNGGVQRLAGIRAGRAGALGDGDPDPPRHLAHRGGIIHAELLHKKRVDVARFMADEAVEHPLLGNDGEVTMRAAVKGAPAPVIRPGAFELDGFADDADQICRFTDLLDDVVGDHWADGRMGGWADGSTRSSRSGATTSRIEPISTTTRPSERISTTMPTFPCPGRTRPPICNSLDPPIRRSADPPVFSIASSTIRRASFAVASVTAARAWPSAASTVFRASRR